MSRRACVSGGSVSAVQILRCPRCGQAAPVQSLDCIACGAMLRSTLRRWARATSTRSASSSPSSRSWPSSTTSSARRAVPPFDRSSSDAAMDRRIRPLLIAVAVIATLVSCAVPAVAPDVGSAGSVALATVPGTAPTTLLSCGSKGTFVYASYPSTQPDLTSIDLYTPAADSRGCTGRPIVVWVHGGGWTSGDKSEYMADKVSLFNGAGLRLRQRELPADGQDPPRTGPAAPRARPGHRRRRRMDRAPRR